MANFNPRKRRLEQQTQTEQTEQIEQIEPDAPETDSTENRLAGLFGRPIMLGLAAAAVILAVSVWLMGGDGGAEADRLALLEESNRRLEESNQRLEQVVDSLVESNTEMAAALKRLDNSSLDLVRRNKQNTERMLEALNASQEQASIPNPTETAAVDGCFMWLWCDE